MIINGHRLKPIDPNEARKLPDGTALIVQRIWRDFKTYAVVRTEYYRAVVRRRKTIAGPDAAVCSEPDSTWPAIPTWQDGWIWLEGASNLGYYTIEEAPE